MLSGGAKYTVDDLKRQQHDVVAWNAEQLVPRLGALHASAAQVDEARRRLLAWDKRIAADSPVAALYVFWEQALRRKLSEGRVPAALLDDYLAHAELSLPDALKASDAVLLDALAAAVDRMRTQTPSDNRAPVWGALHRVLFTHPLAVTQASRRRYDVGPFEQGGYAGTVMFSSTRSSVNTGASFRQNCRRGRLGSVGRDECAGTVGVAAQPAFLGSRVRCGRADKYFPLAYSDRAVKANTETTLVLTSAF